MNTAACYRDAGHGVPDYVPDEATWPPLGLVLVDEIKSFIRDEVAAQLAAKQGIQPTGELSTTQAMAALGYTDRSSFLNYARKHGIAYQRLSARKFRWSAASIHAHKTRRTVGKPKR